jgi:hypothetical protein
MRRVWWVAKVAALVAASYCIFSPGGSRGLPVARAEGCDTSNVCIWNGLHCYCSTVGTGGSSCAGCFIRPYETGCGRCSEEPEIY